MGGQYSDGESLLTLAEGKTPDEWRKAIFFLGVDEGHYVKPGSVAEPGPHSERKPNDNLTSPAFYGVATERYRLIFYPYNNGTEMYDIKNDPYELNNMLSGKKSEYDRETLATLDKMLTYMHKLDGCRGAEDCRVQ